MSDDGKDIFELQYEVISLIESFATNYSKTPKERFNEGYLSSRATGWDNLWNEFSNNHRSVISNATSDEYQSQRYFTENLFDKYETMYYEVSGRIAQKKIDLTKAAVSLPYTSTSTSISMVEPKSQSTIGSICNPIASTSNPTSAYPLPSTGATAIIPDVHSEADNLNQHEEPLHQMQPPLMQFNNTHHVQIPRLNVPVFSGAYDEWPSFRDLFVAAVHSNPNLQSVHKLQYLKSLLKGNAETILKYVATTSDNYAIAWQKLEERFDNKRAIITNTLRKLFNQHHAEDNASHIRQLLDTSRECISALQSQGIDTRTWDCILIFIISQFVPTTSLNLWEQSLPPNELPTINNLLNFLDNRFRTLEFAPQPQSHQSRQRAKPQSFHSTTSTCRVCNGPSHPLRICPKFLEMQPKQRLDHVSNQSYARTVLPSATLQMHVKARASAIHAAIVITPCST